MAHNARQSVCVEYLSWWNYARYDWCSHGGAYLHTDQRVEPCAGILGGLMTEKIHYQKKKPPGN